MSAAVKDFLTAIESLHRGRGGPSEVGRFIGPRYHPIHSGGEHVASIERNPQGVPIALHLTPEYRMEIYRSLPPMISERDPTIYGLRLVVTPTPPKQDWSDPTHQWQECVDGQSAPEEPK